MDEQNNPQVPPQQPDTNEPVETEVPAGTAGAGEQAPMPAEGDEAPAA